MLYRICAVAHLIIVDGLRRYAIIGLILMALSLEAGGLLFMDFIPRDIGRVSGDFILTVGWFTAFLFLLFHAVQVAAWDDERRTIHTLLSRPISRMQYVLGIFAGLTFLLLILNIIIALIGYVTLILIKGSVEKQYFTSLSLFNYSISWIGLLSVELIILSIIILFSSMIRGSFPVLLLTVSYYLICSGLPVVRTIAQSDDTKQIISIDTVLTWLTIVFPDFTRFDFKSLITEQNHLLIEQLILNSIFLFLFLLITLFLASFIYKQRDLR